MNHFLRVSCLIFIVLWGIGCASSSPPSHTSDTSAFPSGDAAICQGDIVSIRITGVNPEINLSDEVNEFGMVTLPYIKEIKAEGLTPGVLAKKIEQAYIDGGYYTKLGVSVVVGQRTLYIHGEVRGSGTIPWTPGLTLVRAISLAGGFSDYADRSNIEIRRRGSTIKVSFKEAEANPSKDVPVFPRDEIKVGKTIF